MLLRNVAAVGIFMTFISASSFAQVYKCDSKGKMVYSDKPCVGERSRMNGGGGVSVVPSQSSGSYNHSAHSTENYGHAPQANQVTEVQNRGEAFARSGSNPAPRKTVSTLLPNGGSIAQRQGSLQRKPRPQPPAPTSITHCTGAFCYDNLGGTYHGHGPGAPTMTGPSGKTCVRTGDMVHC